MQCLAGPGDEVIVSEPIYATYEAVIGASGARMVTVPLRPEAVLEVSYDHLQHNRFRHATSMVRWRPDREPSSCTYEQLDTPVPMELADVFGTSAT